MSRVEWWCDTLLKQATVPTLLTVRLWANVALIAASLEPADSIHTIYCSHQRNHTQNFMKFLFIVFTSLPFFPLSSYSPPWTPVFFFFLAPPPNRQERLLPCFSARLPSCPEAFEYLVSSLTANISPLSARSKTWSGREIKRRKGGLHQDV